MPFRLMQSLRALFSGAETEPPSAADLTDPRVAAAALLCKAALVDGSLGPAEAGRLERLVARHFGMDADSAADLIETAARVEADTSDIADIARRLTLSLDTEARRDLVARMWDIASVDGHVHEFEEATIMRIADLFGLSLDEISGLRAAVELDRLAQR